MRAVRTRTGLLAVGMWLATGAIALAQLASSASPRGSLGQGAPAQPDTWYVDASATGPGTGTWLDPYKELAPALSSPQLSPGDTVLVAPGTYQGPVVAPPFGITVRATAGAGQTVVDAASTAPALVLAGTDGVPVVVEGLALTAGAGTSVSPIFSAGGGVQADGARFELRSCVIRGNDAFWGGGVYSKNSVGTLEQCIVKGNTNTGFGARGAGVMVDGGSLWIEDCRIRNNTSGDFFAPGNGGGVYEQGGADLDVVDTVIELNIAEFGGGGTYGGGDYLGCTLRGNIGQFGGGANATSGTSFTDCLFETNEADSVGGTSHFGGAVYGPATLVGCTLRANLSFGGVAGADGALLIDCLVEDNLAVPGYGGVNDLSGGVGNALVIDTTLRDNIAAGGELYFGHGGGAAFSTVVGCDVVGNSVQPDPGYRGGGTYQCDVRHSTFSDNVSSGRGGGAFGGSLFRCIIYDNSAEAGGGASDADLDHCTLEGNQAALGDGLWFDAQAVAAVSNSIVFFNGDEEIAVDPEADLTVSYTDVLGGWPGVGNIDADPAFWSRPLDDFHLRPVSPCIDAGDPLYKLDSDGTITDMGALRGDRYYPPPDGSGNFGPSSKP